MTTTANRGGCPPAPARELLVRPRLVRLLQRRFECRVTTVVAGPGFGKTSLLVQAMAENRLSPRGVEAWLGCSSRHSVASTLAAGLASALEVPADAMPGSVQGAVQVVEAAVWRRSPTPVVFVLDDVHLIEPASPGARLLADLLDRLPGNAHLLLAGRSPLPVPTARLSVLGQAAELGERELALDEEELVEFAALRGIAPELVARTGGWPALAELTASVGDQRALDFLWEELLSRLPADRRRLLAALAVAGGADEEVAAALADDPVNLDEVLVGLPLVSGQPGGWRSLHSLWAPALARQLSEGEANDVRRRAAAAFQRRGLVDPAVRLLTTARAWEALRTLIRDTAAPSHPVVAPDVFSAWYSGLPEDLQRGPEGLLLRGVVDKGRDLPAAVQPLERAAEKFRLRGDVRGETAALTHLGHISWWLRDADRLTAVAEQAARLDAGSDNAIAAAAFAHVLLAEITGQPRRVLALLAAIPADRISTEWSASVEWLRAWALLTLGEPEQARAHAQASVARAAGTFASTSIYIQVLTTWFSGEISAALDALPRLADASALTGRGYSTVVGRGTCALLLGYTGHEQAARDHLTTAGAALPGTGGGAAEIVYAMAEAAILVAGGEEERAGRLLVTELAERPLQQPRTSQLHQLFLSLSYLLVPSTRPQWDGAELGPRFATARTLARALVTLRESGTPAVVRDVPLPAPDVVRALLPVPWAAELAGGLAAAGRPAGSRLLAALGPAARSALHRLAATAPAEIVRAARGLLSELPVTAPYRLRLDVLGTIRLHRGETVVEHPALRRDRVQQLLGYLLVHRNASRSTLAAALWPDLDDADADRNLRVTMTYLNRLLEPDRPDGDPPFFLCSAGATLWLIRDEALDVDVWRFDRLLDAAEQADRSGVPSQALNSYRQALPLYRGDLLADHPELDWADFDRDRLRRRHHAAAIRTGELLLAGGDVTTPLTLAEQVLRTDRWSEPAYRLMMATELARADHAAARRTLHRCQAMLADLGARPDPHTDMLARRLTAPTAGGHSGHDHTRSPAAADGLRRPATPPTARSAPTAAARPRIHPTRPDSISQDHEAPPVPWRV